MAIFIKSAFTAALASLLLFSCAKDKSSGGADDDLTSRGSISGQVLDGDGNKAGGVAVSVSGTGYATVSMPNGNFTLSDVAAGTYTLYLQRYGFITDSITGIQLARGQAYILDQTVTIVSTFCTLKGQVASTALPKAGAGKASLMGITISIPHQSVSGVTDPTGAFTLHNVTPDAKWVIATMQGVGWGSAALDLKPGDKVLGLAINLDNIGGSIVGEIKDAQGNPVANLPVSAVSGSLTDTTDTQGSFQLTNIPSSTPVNVEGGSYSVSGLVVDEKSQLDGIVLSENSTVSSDTITLNNSLYVVPDTGNVIVQPDISFTGISQEVADNIALFVWDTDNDGIYDTITNTSSISLGNTANNTVVKYGIITTGGDTLSGAEITITRVTAAPQAKVGQTITIERRAQADLLGKAICQTGGIISYQWDFDGDGIYDWKRSDVGTVKYRYFKAGTYNARFLVIANNGLRDSGTVVITVDTTTAAIPANVVAPPAITSPVPGSKVEASFSLEWANVAADSYSVYIGTTTPPDSLLISGVTDTFHIVKGLNMSSIFYFQVQAYKADNPSPGLSAKVETGPNLPPVVNNSALMPIANDTAGADSVLLTWQASDPNAQSLVYTVYFGLATPPGEYVSGITDTFIKVQPPGGWQDSVPYYWQILADDGTDTTYSQELMFFYISGYQ